MGNTPTKMMPKIREYVDHGSSLFVGVVRNVPLLAPKNQSMVIREVRELSVARMLGVPHDDDEEAAEGQETADDDEKLHQPSAISSPPA